MSWNYRVVSRESSLGIYEAYYDQDGQLHSISSDPVSRTCDDIESLKVDIQLMLEACQKNVVDYETLKEVAEICSSPE